MGAPRGSWLDDGPARIGGPSAEAGAALFCALLGVAGSAWMFEWGDAHPSSDAWWPCLPGLLLGAVGFALGARVVRTSRQLTKRARATEVIGWIAVGVASGVCALEVFGIWAIASGWADTSSLAVALVEKRAM